ncbi:Uncharacterized protein DBV15_00563 [Temnothorax longispinosus]|uniref:Uncharacterized protein n=1 Tax=Temnothorax longispinosus TaxID=300112 RepID=A0A4S2KY25_9HYME|nr:Uncharacterized protein DBV15_00563 [Temnothorax longispinosus]
MNILYFCAFASKFLARDPLRNLNSCYFAPTLFLNNIQSDAHAAFEVAHNPHHGMPLTKDLWYCAYAG